MKNFRLWRRIPILATFCALAACFGAGGGSLQAASLPVVGRANSAPTITDTPPGTAKVAQHDLFAPGASHTEGDTLTFGINNRLVWTTLAAIDGKLSGTPTTGAKPGYPDVQISKDFSRRLIAGKFASTTWRTNQYRDSL